MAKPFNNLRVKLLVKQLGKLAYRPHEYCEDTWYNCPKHPEGCANDSWPKNECNCGADSHNKEVDEILGQLEAILEGY